MNHELWAGDKTVVITCERCDFSWYGPKRLGLEAFNEHLRLNCKPEETGVMLFRQPEGK
jgi:hypothetical protein